MTENTDDLKRIGTFHSGPQYKTHLFRIQATLRSALAQGLKLIRRGNKVIYITNPIARGGNWLYYWAHAHALTQDSSSTIAKVLYAPGMETWINEFPSLNNYTIEPQDVKFTDRRSVLFPNDIELNFTEEEIKSFIHEDILLSQNFKERFNKYKDIINNNTVIITVRRGDYYSVPAVKKRFGINTVEYIKAATQEMLKRVEPSQIIFVSDDIDWCTQNLSFLSNYASIIKLDRKDMFDDLAVMTLASHLILTNTSFGYWGGYISEVYSPTTIYVPNVHEYDATHRLDAVSKDKTGRPHSHRRSWISISNPDGEHWITGEKND